jgi:hypothetical protein
MIFVVSIGGEGGIIRTPKVVLMRASPFEPVSYSLWFPMKNQDRL